MSDRRDESERDTLAAEHALRLLDGDERRQATALEAADSAFARDVARWRGRISTLFAESKAIAAPEGMWARIERATATEPSNVIVLRRKASAWRAAAIGMSALAASLGLVLVLQPRDLPAPIVQQQQPQTPLVALLGDDGKPAKVVASWDPAARQLVLAIPGDMPADPSHSHELWVIPAGGAPRSLGTRPARKKMHMRLAEALARLLQQGATIAISVEPPGGSPSGKPTGPVVAAGALDRT
jgi:anti-sigma-K factor RskA